VTGIDVIICNKKFAAEKCINGQMKKKQRTKLKETMEALCCFVFEEICRHDKTTN